MNISESEHIEFKKSTSLLKSALKSISAILNKHRKGELYFGLKNDGTPVKNSYSEKTLREISQTISHKIEPQIYPTITFVDINSIKVIKVTFEGFDVPYSAEGRYYLRVADEDKQLSSSELRKIILDNQDVRWDKLTNNNSTLKDIAPAKVREFCRLSGTSFTNLNDIFESTGLFLNNNLINAAVILFGKRPQKFFTNAKLMCSVFATNNTAHIIDQQEFAGDLFYLIKESENYILKNIHIGMNVKGLYREDIPEIDREALREVIINAFLHRDYFDPDFISISIFKDRLEVKNPGGLFGGLKIEDILRRNISKRRNEVIADVFSRVRFVERKGRGIALILEKEPGTHFEQLGNIFITTMKRKTDLIPQYYGGLTGGLKDVFEFIKANAGQNTKTISIAISKPEKTVEKWIKKLRELNLIEFKGSKKTGGYHLTPNNAIATKTQRHKE